MFLEIHNFSMLKNLAYNNKIKSLLQFVLIQRLLMVEYQVVNCCEKFTFASATSMASSHMCISWYISMASSTWF